MMPPVSEPEDPKTDPPSLFQTAMAKMRSMNRRYLTYFIVGGIVVDVLIVAAGLWWLGVFDSDPAAAARDSLSACIQGSPTQDGAAMIDTCHETVAHATGSPDARRDPANTEIAAQALRQIQVICRVALERAALTRCAEMPVIEGIVPDLAVRTRVEALLRLGDHARLREEATRLIRYGDGFGYLARGLAHHATGDYASAVADYREALKRFPDDPTLLDNLARAEVSAPPS
jgi:tetratricopeptide (TPR) repeat protein